MSRYQYYPLKQIVFGKIKNKTEEVLNKVYLWDRKIGKKDSGKGNMLKE